VGDPKLSWLQGSRQARHDHVMETVAQWVRVLYTRRSRGAPAAAARNALPIAFRLPFDDVPVLHEVTMREREGFAIHEELNRRPPSGDEVRLRLADGRLRLELTPSSGGMPLRHRPAPVLSLRPGEWARWQVNYRFVERCTGAWWYRSDTLNLAHGPVHPDVFLGRPTRLVDERALLR
jgi:hypothetical protein